MKIMPNLCRLLLVLVILFTLFAVVATSAVAAAAITLDRVQGPVGTSVLITATGFTPGAPLEATFDGTGVGLGITDPFGSADIPFTVPDVPPGVYSVSVTDGISIASAPFTVIGDTTPPSVAMVSPPSGYSLQDGVTFVGSAIDSESGVISVTFSIREDNGGNGNPIGLEDLPSIHDSGTNNWTLWFDTLQLPDGWYVVVVKATDNAGNVGSITVPYSIRNWVCIKLLPSTPNSKAGRSVAVKFAIKVAPSVDPAQPDVYNENLKIKIYATSNPGVILQTSTFGSGPGNYRIVGNGFYITNFQTSKVPMEYTVEIWRADINWLVASFTFKTVH